MIQFNTELIAIGNTKVIDPATNELAGLEELIFHRHSPVAVRQTPNLLLELLQCFRVPLNASSPESKSEKFAFIGFNDAAFGRVNDQFQAVLQISTDAAKHAFTGSLTFHQDGEVVSVPCKFVTTALKFFVQRV